MRKMKSLIAILLLFYSTISLKSIAANPTADQKFIQDFERFMDAFCVHEDIDPEILRKLDECDAIVFSKEGKEMENECMIEAAPKGSTVNDRRRLWCTDQNYYQKTRNCYSKKLESKHKRGGSAGEQISEEQLKNDTIRAMECRKRVFKF